MEQKQSPVRSVMNMVRREKPPSTDVEEQQKVNELRAAIGPLEGCLKTFCSDQCLRRYLRARNWNLKKSEKMLRDTLKWREEYKPEEILWGEIAQESETAKMYRASFRDKEGHAVLVLVPGRQNTAGHGNQIRHLVYCIENAILSLPDGQEQVLWIVDYEGYSMSNAPPFKTSLETLNILQNHYPERLAYALLYNAPQLFEAFWTVIRPFMDAKTVNKVKFLNTSTQAGQKMIEEIFDLDTLDAKYGGRAELKYDHEEYAKSRIQDDSRAAEFWGLQSKDSVTDAVNKEIPLQVDQKTEGEVQQENGK